MRSQEQRESGHRPLIAVSVVVAAAAAAFAALTNGFTAVTSEAARRVSVADSPRTLPMLLGTDQDGRRQTLFADGAGRVTIVDFIYTRCTSICRALGDGGRQLQAAIVSRRLERRVRLVTVSFDPARDSIDALNRYAMLMHADPAVWTLLRPDDAEKLEEVLAAFGIVVVPAPFEQFEHNAAFHVLDANGRLARIVDADDALGALEAALAMAPPASPLP